MPVKKKTRGKSKLKAKQIRTIPLIQDSSESDELLLRFLHRVLHWLHSNYARSIDIFRRFDSDNDNLLSSDEFAVGMRIMEAPMTKAEVQSLVKLLDVDGDGMINILEFDKIIRRHYHTLLAQLQALFSPTGSSSDGSRCSTPGLLFSPSRVSTKCPSCEIGIAEPPIERNPKYVKLKVSLATFKDLKTHPSHFEIEVTDSTTIHGLKGTVQTHLEEAVDSIALFKEPTCSMTSYLSPSHCLHHCGLVGGPKADPTDAEVFYDYVPIVMDCPILMADSHIREPKTSQGKKACENGSKSSRTT